MQANRRSNVFHQSIVDELVLMEHMKLRKRRTIFEKNCDGVENVEVKEEKKDCDEKNSGNKPFDDDDDDDDKPPINIFCLDGGGSKGEIFL